VSASYFFSMLVKFGTIHFQHFSGLKCHNFTFNILLNSFQRFLLFIICYPFLLILQVSWFSPAK
jgi:hypothetical protein